VAREEKSGASQLAKGGGSHSFYAMVHDNCDDPQDHLPLFMNRFLTLSENSYILETDIWGLLSRMSNRESNIEILMPRFKDKKI
jgi:hypothetical protein